MRLKKQVGVIFGAFVVMIGALLIIVLRPRDPSYKDKRLSEYLAGFSKDGFMIHNQPPYGLVVSFRPTPERHEAWEALGHFGDEALPTFVRLAGAKDSKLARMIDPWVRKKMPFLKIRLATASEKRRLAVTAFVRYGTRAAPAIPQLLPLLNDSQTAQAAVYALSFIKPTDKAAILALTNVLAASGSMLQLEAIAALAACGSNAAPAAPALFRLLNSTNAQASAMSAVALARIGAGQTKAAELIAERLSSAPQSGFLAPPLEMYLWALGEIGGAAENARVRIAAFTNSASARVRELALEAIHQIGDAVEQ